MLRTAEPRQMKVSQIYKESGLLYIRYDANIKHNSYGQKKIKFNRPAFSKITNQIEYGKGSGRYYSLLMGREIKPGQYAILWTLIIRLKVIQRAV